MKGTTPGRVLPYQVRLAKLQEAAEEFPEQGEQRLRVTITMPTPTLTGVAMVARAVPAQELILPIGHRKADVLRLPDTTVYRREAATLILLRQGATALLPRRRPGVIARLRRHRPGAIALPHRLLQGVTVHLHREVVAGAPVLQVAVAEAVDQDNLNSVSSLELPFKKSYFEG